MHDSKQENKKKRPLLGFWESDEAMSVATSVAIHAAIVILFLLLVRKLPSGAERGGDFLAGLDRAWDKVETDAPQLVPAINHNNTTTNTAASAALATATILADTNNANNLLQAMLAESGAALGASGSENETNITTANKAAEFAEGGGLNGRTAAHREACLATGDTTGDSEAAVEAALAWLARHQCRKDGGWSFRNNISCQCDACRCLCSHQGTHGSRVAATSLALMTFLGAGYTHTSGRYQSVVERGFLFLLDEKRLRRHNDVGGIIDASQDIYPQRYINALAAIAMSEGYAMTRSPQLREAAQGLVAYIVAAQNRQDGGWGYSPTHKSRGDISITGWQLMALKSAHLAELHVPRETLYRTSAFLDTVSQNEGREYNYLVDKTLSGKGEGSVGTCNAIGLLLRMYLGERAGYAPLDGGMEILTKRGVSVRFVEPCNLFEYYYASLAQHHYGSSAWRRWYTPLRDALVATQSTRGEENGSWFFPSPEYGDPGGRLLNTAIAAMILEVPYRYMPLYR